jgi:HCOMODA/2-hydroxy-3-carboxy-muconic semialdehyde decarboxylase
MSAPTPEHQRTVRLAARALARAGLVHAFGHCSVRLDAKTFLVCAARPMGLIEDGDGGTVVGVDGALPAGVLGEVRMHQQIYRRRPDVGAICRFLSPHVMTLAAMGQTPRARHGFGAYFHPQPPMWQDPQLVRNDSSARAVAETLGSAPAIVVGVNGAVTAATDMPRALALAWFLEDAARVELAVRAAGGEAHASFADAEAARQRATWEGRIAERMWEVLTHEPNNSTAGDTRP